MRMSGLLVLTSVTLLFAAGQPASAQLAGDYELPPGSYSWGPYLVTDDGALTYDGDVRVGCGSLIAMGAPQGSRSDAEPVIEPLTVEAVELCTVAGFPPSGVENSAADLASGENDRLVGPRPIQYDVLRDGTLVIGGDVSVIEYCRLAAEGSEKIEPKKEAYAEVCERSDFSAAGDDVLPETGGIRTAVLLTAAASVLAGSIVTLARVR